MRDDEMGWRFRGFVSCLLLTLPQGLIGAIYEEFEDSPEWQYHMESSDWVTVTEEAGS